MSNFINYTVGLECHTNRGILPVRVAYSKVSGGVELQPVSARTLASFGVGLSKIISREDFDNRPRDPYDSVAQAIWALDQVGFAPAALSGPRP